jgi:hypothetical protein
MPRLRFSMMILLVIGGGYARGDDAADMNSCAAIDKLDNSE